MNKWSFLVCSLYIIYFVALLLQNDVIGDLLSPLLTFLVFLPLFWGYFLKEKSSFFKVSGLLLSLSVFTWFLCDFFWGLSSLVLQVDPEENFWIVNGYSLTNLFLLLSLIVFGIYELKQWNRMQIFLDTMMVSASLMILIWVFIFQKNMDNAALLLQDPVAMFSLITNFLIYGWSNIWFFSIREKETPNFLRIAVAGGIIFAVTDMVYYYICFYESYEANSIIDGFYLLAFTFFGLSGYLKAKNQEKIQGAYVPMKKVALLNFASVKKEMLFLLVPVLLLLFQEFDPGIMLFTVTIIMFYFIFTRYNQSNIYRDELFFASPFWRKLQSVFGESCISKMAKVAKLI